MSIRTILTSTTPSRSLEFYPPKTEAGWRALFARVARFSELAPDFVSVTYGAGGTTRARTQRLVEELARNGSLTVIPHLTCVCHTRQQVEGLLSSYVQLGIRGIMALGGDPPQRGGEDCPSDFSFASELVELIHGFAARSVPDSEGITVGVAGFPEGHPATPNRVDELDFLKRKVDAGADYICTQLFFDNRDFYDFRERCALAGIEIPILAGIMPLTTLANYQRLPSLALGARYPAALIRRMMECGSDEDVFKIGLEWSVSQCRDLLAQGVDGLHFYTLNQYVAVKRLWEELR